MFMLPTPFVFLPLTHRPDYACNKTHSEASMQLLHVSALGCHHQGALQNKGIQGQHA
jgi:hypothetical protein